MEESRKEERRCHPKNSVHICVFQGSFGGTFQTPGRARGKAHAAGTVTCGEAGTGWAAGRRVTDAGESAPPSEFCMLGPRVEESRGEEATTYPGIPGHQTLQLLLNQS